MVYSPRRQNESSGDSKGCGCVGAIIGCLIIFYSMNLLWLNEYLAKNNYLIGEYAKNNYVETATDHIENNKDGKLVRFYGLTSTNEKLKDDIFNIDVDECLNLSRVVEMYQWVEKKHSHSVKKGKRYETYYTYTYEKGWYRSVINSAVFNQSSIHTNPKVMIYNNTCFPAKNVTIGAHKIPSGLTKFLSEPERINLDLKTISLPSTASVIDNYILFNVDQELNARKEEKGKKNLFGGNKSNINKKTVDAKSPQIGDIRISFYRYPLCNATVLAKQKDDSIVPFKTPYGGKYMNLTPVVRVYKKGESDKSMEDTKPATVYDGIFIIKEGNISVKDLFPNFESSNNNISMWVGRIFFSVLMIIGLGLISILKKIKIGFIIFLPIMISCGIIAFTWILCKPVFGTFFFGMMLLSLVICLVGAFKIRF